MKTRRNLLIAAALALLAGCSSGTESSASPDDPLRPGLYSLVLATSGAEGSSVPVGGWTGTLLLPPGVQVEASADGKVPDSALHLAVPGGAPAMVSGHLLKNPAGVELSVVAAPKSPWKGSFLRLDFLVTNDLPAVTEKSFKALNATLGGYRVVGLDPATHTSVDLTGVVATTFSVTR
ncbi:hypothetical protein [Mesoterricola silvestris]|uniref:Lipoprotein n=1 Tax=Mesoterricola silvestris TaxID=2927979 RepID=A0AA48K950_9BACT|nr:hypothetical protein [Mesoterricola silvestris]BDU71962.1 hypothetical protein METEAL_11360 [Mesoterricola silvestris]